MTVIETIFCSHVGVFSLAIGLGSLFAWGLQTLIERAGK